MVTSSLKTSPRLEEGRIYGSRASQYDNSSPTNAENERYKSYRNVNTSRYVPYIDDGAIGGQVSKENDTRRRGKARASSARVPVQHELKGFGGTLLERPSAEEQLQVDNMSPLFGR
jgi:hypothetical protein